MDSDNRFTLYALILISAVASVISASVMSGIATVPAPIFVAEHLGLGLLFRASYKSFGGKLCTRTPIRAKDCRLP